MLLVLQRGWVVERLFLTATQMKWYDKVWNKAVCCDQIPSQGSFSTHSKETCDWSHDPSTVILPCLSGITMQTRDDAWILNQIKRVRSDTNGRQSPCPCWINEFPGFLLHASFLNNLTNQLSLPSASFQSSHSRLRNAISVYVAEEYMMATF